MRLEVNGGSCIQRVAERIGVVATDPLRVLGLKAIFCEAMQLEIVHLSVPGALDDVNLSLVLIDAECTNHLFELIATFRQVRPQLKLIVLGTETCQEYIQRVIGAGAKGYLTLTAKETEHSHGHRDGARRLRLGPAQGALPPARPAARLHQVRQPRRQSSPPREIQVLKLLRAGQPNREIAIALGIDESTVKAHIGRLMRKVGVNNRIALTVHPFTQFE